MIVHQFECVIVESFAAMNGHSVATVSPFDLMQIYDDPKYAEDDLVRYLSMRDNGHQTRDQYLNSIDPKRKARLEHERDRVAKLRVKFFANQTKQDLIATHEGRRREWREEAINSRVRNLQDLETRREKYEASNQEPCEDRTRRIKVFQNEKRILEAIEKWEEHSSVLLAPCIAPGGTENKKFDYGLKACIMHFKKGGGGHTHKHKHKGVIGEFPNQKVPINDLLTDTPDNLLKEPCKDGMFRYFHLPTNNMAWIEVRELHFPGSDISDVNMTSRKS